VGSLRRIGRPEDARRTACCALALGLILGVYEGATTSHSWRNVNPSIVRYLQMAQPMPRGRRRVTAREGGP